MALAFVQIESYDIHGWPSGCACRETMSTFSLCGANHATTLPWRPSRFIQLATALGSQLAIVAMSYRFRLTAHNRTPGFFFVTEATASIELAEGLTLAVVPRDADSLADATR